MTRKLFNLLVLSAMTLALTPQAGRAAPSMQINPGCETFGPTNKQVCGKFLTYWQRNGGLAQQGYPISEQFTEVSDVDGKTYIVQYFERAVFELHPENQPPYDVLLSLLGTTLYKQKYPNGAPRQNINNEPGSILFKETNQRVGGAFLDYWQRNGGLAQQGFPISGEFQERSELDGKVYTVQYFERAVFEWHPENAPEHRVLLSQLGTYQFKRKYSAGVEQGTALTKGGWGGEHISMLVADDNAVFQFDCARGYTDKPIIVDSEGNFRTSGVFIFERGGPVRDDMPLDAHPAIYAGKVSGNSITMTITLQDLKREIGSYTLKLGQPGRVFKCL